METTTMKDAAKTSLTKQGENATGSRKVTLSEAIQLQRAGFALALPKDFDADRFTRIAITAIRNSPKLMQCEPASILGALMLCAQLGLEPNSPLHEASIIPYGGKAQFQIEYRGLLKLVWNSGLISYIDYDKVCEKDAFEYSKGFDPKLEHKPAMSDRGKTICYYAIAELQGGGKVYIVKSVDDIKKHAARFSKAFGDKYKDSPWQTDFDSMGIKTVLKELCDKKLPKRTTNEALRFAQALSKDEHIAQISDENLLKAQAKRLELDDVQTDEADYSEDDTVAETVKTGETDPTKPQTTATEPNKEVEVDYSNTTQILQRIETIKSVAELINWEKKHKVDLEMIGGKDSELIQLALADKKASFKGGAK
jgi:recombination protein RecT